jgi:hypothetical protein
MHFKYIAEFYTALATKHAIARPCSKCSTSMVLQRIAPKGADYLYGYECPACNHWETEIVQP